MTTEDEKVNELIEAIKTINEFKKMQDSYIAELERQNEELREKLAGVEEELDKMKKDNPYKGELEEIYKKYFGKKQDTYLPPNVPWVSPSHVPAPQWPTDNNSWVKYTDNTDSIKGYSSGSISIDDEYSNGPKTKSSSTLQEDYNKIMDQYIKPRDGFETDDG